MNSREMARRLACVRNDLPDGAVLVLEPGVQGRPEPLFTQFPVR